MLLNRPLDFRYAKIAAGNKASSPSPVRGAFVGMGDEQQPIFVNRVEMPPAPQTLQACLTQITYTAVEENFRN